jgi:hypothetical protein
MKGLRSNTHAVIACNPERLNSCRGRKQMEARWQEIHLDDQRNAFAVWSTRISGKPGRIHQ